MQSIWKPWTLEPTPGRTKIKRIAKPFMDFFSSRRRHTRWPRDWSSDVCSSDLQSRGHLVCRLLLRSEERRVGKECRSRWSPHHYKIKTHMPGGRGGESWA